MLEWKYPFFGVPRDQKTVFYRMSLEIKLLDRFPQSLQQTYQLGQFTVDAPERF